MNNHGPIWFVANWLSIPSSLNWNGQDMIPALLIKISILGTSAQLFTSSAAARTVWIDPKSSLRSLIGQVGEMALISASAAERVEDERPARMRRDGECTASAFAV